jgi:hypothetical protein
VIFVNINEDSHTTALVITKQNKTENFPRTALLTWVLAKIPVFEPSDASAAMVNTAFS